MYSLEFMAYEGYIVNGPPLRVFKHLLGFNMTLKNMFLIFYPEPGFRFSPCTTSYLS